MSVAVVAVVIACLAAAAIERAVTAGRYKADAAEYRVKCEAFKAEAIRIKHDYQRIQAAQNQALEAAEAAIGAGDPRRALAELARLQEGSGKRLYDRDTSDMLASAAAAAVAAADDLNGLRKRQGLLGRFARGSDRAVGREGGPVDDEG